MINISIKVTKYMMTAIFIFILSSEILAQSKKGCTDPRAKNYSPEATINNGDCNYPLTIFTPKLKFYLPEEVKETSGLVFFNNGLWTMNDSGGEPVLYKIDTMSGKITQKITIKNAVNIDWEDLATDGKFVYIGDFGNNSGNRNDLRIYKIKLSDIPAEGNKQVEAKIIEFKFSDRGNSKIESRKQNNYDCEAFTVIGDSLYLFSKNWENQKTRVYTLPTKQGKYVAELKSTYDVSGLITAADYNKDYKELILLGYKNKTWIPFLWIFSDFKDDNIFSGNKRRITMPKIITTQTEGITYTEGKNVMISSESTKIGKQSLYTLNTGQWTNKAFEKELAKANEKLIREIEPVSNKKIKVFPEYLHDGEYKTTIYDVAGNKYEVKRTKLKEKNGTFVMSLKTQRLEKGLYFLKLSVNEKEDAKSFSIK
jgi:hypothetical protein